MLFWHIFLCILMHNPCFSETDEGSVWRREAEGRAARRRGEEGLGPGWVFLPRRAAAASRNCPCVFPCLFWLP